MVQYTDTLIVSEFRSGKSIDKIASDMLLTEKVKGNKVNKLDCKQKVEIAILNYLILNNRTAGQLQYTAKEDTAVIVG